MQLRRSRRGNESAVKEWRRARELTGVVDEAWMMWSRCGVDVEVAREVVPVGCSRRCVAVIRGGWASRRAKLHLRSATPR
jgi:hypothetical protein